MPTICTGSGKPPTSSRALTDIFGAGRCPNCGDIVDVDANNNKIEPHTNEETEMPTITIPAVTDLTDAELETICEALDSHLYWQVNEDESRRNSGYIMEPLTEDEQEVSDLETKVRAIINARTT